MSAPASFDGEGGPILAVVGHPNKGKSSLVSTLASDDSVGVSATPGTTLRSRPYPMTVDGRCLYTLVDTPGFQRARHVLAWLEERAAQIGANAADRPRLVSEFVADPDHGARFPDECELLRPLVEGAGILYVVDGGVPYGPEYEAEMEVLRWTGRPSLAVINPIGRDDHVPEWEAALGQFFRVVRVIDAVHADFATRRQLLLAFGELETDWRSPIEAAVAALDGERLSLARQAASEIAQLISDALSLSVEHRLASHEEAKSHEGELEAEYKTSLAVREEKHRRSVERIYGHHELESNARAFELLEADLFSEGTWLVFGLRRRDLVTLGAIGGAATGGLLDAAIGGASFLMGTALGGALGGAFAWVGADRLAELTVVNQRMGGRLARYGPSRNVNFPFVLFGRARIHALLIAERTHARRDVLDLSVTDRLEEGLALEAKTQRELGTLFAELRKRSPGSPKHSAAFARLSGMLSEILLQDAGGNAERGARF